MILTKKAFRSILQNKGAYLACIMLIAIAILIYTSMGISTTGVLSSKDKFYSEYNMADIFASVQSIPASAKERLLDIEGIEDAVFRVVREVPVIIDDNGSSGGAAPTIRLVSVDPDSTINQLHVLGGNHSADNDILIGADFLTAHSLEIGDSLRLVINGTVRELNIAGCAISPEYVYMIKDAKELVPDPKAFTVAFMPIDNLMHFLSLDGYYNDLCFTLSPGYSYDNVKTELADALSPYGLNYIIDKKDQLSYNMLEAELQSNESMTTALPLLFIFLAAIILYLMLKRVIEQDRVQIGTMKAMGYANPAIQLHYLAYGLITGFAGGLVGSISGYYCCGLFIEMYKEFFKLPEITAAAAPPYFIKGFAIAIACGILGAFLGTKSALKLNPSEAMRPPAPPAVKSDPFRFLPFMKYMLTSGGFMAVRNMARNKFRTFFIVLGITFSFGLMAFMASYDRMIDDIIIDHFSKVQIYDAKLNLSIPTNMNTVISNTFDIPGVTDAEGIVELPAQLAYKNLTAGVSIVGIEAGSALYQVYDSDLQRAVPINSDGIILNQTLAKKLEARAGDIIYISSPLLENDAEVPVTKIVTQYLGSSAYMELSALGKIFGMRDSVTGVLLNTNDLAQLKAYSITAANIDFLEDKVSTLNTYDQLFESYLGLIAIMQVMAAAIAFAIIYNTATISLSERKREFATLRVMGLHTKEVSAILSFEYFILTGISIALGVPFTIFLKTVMYEVMSTDLFAIPTFTPVNAFISAGIGCIMAVIFANAASKRKISKFDMVEVLKEKE